MQIRILAVTAALWTGCAAALAQEPGSAHGDVVAASRENEALTAQTGTGEGHACRVDGQTRHSEPEQPALIDDLLALPRTEDAPMAIDVASGAAAGP
jgi:hypothetical protein